VETPDLVCGNIGGGISGMKKKNVATTLVSLGALALGGVVLRKQTSTKTVKKIVESVVDEPEKFFDGIPLSELSELAKQCYHGVKCTLDEYGYLVFHYLSNSGKTKFDVQMKLDAAGKLKNLGGHYPGQWWSAADQFAELFNKKYRS
jgi:hypothetical protein